MNNQTTQSPEISNKRIYEYAVGAYIFAHSMIWPERRITEAEKETAIYKIYRYLKNRPDVEAAVEEVYKFTMLVIVHDERRMWINRHPKVFTMVLENEEGRWGDLRTEFMKRLHRVVSKVNSIAALYAKYHRAYMKAPSEELVTACIEALKPIDKKGWARRYAEAIEEQNELFGKDVIAQLMQGYDNVDNYEAAVTETVSA